MRHHPVVGGWEFQADRGDLNGGGRTLRQCQDAAEHAARSYFSRVQGYPVPHRDACSRVRHAVECVQPAAA